jgi:hypothetical protein
MFEPPERLSQLSAGLVAAQRPARPSESKTMQGPELAQYYFSTDRALGVKEIDARLVDERTGTTLMTEHFFSADRFVLPHSCGGNERYLQQLHRYIAEAHRRARL